ncbi:DUF5906 domain-containing protein [Methanococcoides sp. FTZ1]|uniref:DUF5906 domain-containing protein n=1 Tax=Methanococcoides sp. FTZ1 TaxID=3439061 RepID=UPI003F861C98
MISHFTGKKEDSDKAELLTLTDSFIEKLNELPWYSNIAAIGKGNLERCFSVSETESKRIKIEHDAVVEAIAEFYNVISFCGQLYIYQGGYYQEGKEKIESMVHEILRNVGFTNNRYKGSFESATREIIHRLVRYDPYTEYPFNNHENIIPVANGFVKIDFDKGIRELIPSDPYYKFNYRLPVVYNPDMSGDIIHNHVITQYVEEEDVDFLYQIPAQAILQTLLPMPYKKFYVLQGDKDAGKTSYLTLLLHTLGDVNISSVSLQQLTSDRFSKANLEGKVMNVYDDMSDIPLKEGGIIKTLTGGAWHWIERKNQQGYDAKINAVHCYACNTPPDVSKLQKDTAFWGRAELIYFPNIFEVDPGFYDRVFTPEHISGFFNKVLDTVIQIRNKGLLCSSSPSEVLERWNYNADPLFRFLDDNMVESQRPMYFDKDDFLRLYHIYCEKEDVDESRRPNNVGTLSQHLFKYGINDVQRTASNGKRGKMYEIYRRWKPDSIYQNKIGRVILKTEQSSI